MTTHDSRPGQTTQRSQDTARPFPAAPPLGIAWIVDGSARAVQQLAGPRLLIGRSEHCEMRLEHASVSRHHAELSRQGSIYELRDFESTNGTWLNGAPVEHGVLALGDLLRCGDCLGVVVPCVSPGDSQAFETLAPGLLGGPTLATALVHAKKAAPSDVPIVIVGETGTGKERIARALHFWSKRAGAFVAVNCATVPAQLAEAELFGHERGAFTGADRARTGLFRAAHGGTLFLDEIGDLPLELQPKLLRAVELGEVMMLGNTNPSSVDVRVVAATHQPLDELVAQGRFRPDLAARMAGFVVDVPALRDRREEIVGLVLHFLSKHTAGRIPRVAPTLLEWLCLRPWPGNVRELELTVRKLIALHGSEPVLRLSYAEELLQGPTSRARTPSLQPPISNVRLGLGDRHASDLHRLRLALELTSGNLTAAAESIGISRRRAYRLLQGERSKRSPG